MNVYYDNPFNNRTYFTSYPEVNHDVEEEFDLSLGALSDERLGNHPGERQFWVFCYLRQAAWARRAVKMNGPNSADPIIANWRFTNLYRELDRGTLFMSQEISDKCTSTRSAAYLISLYRSMNRVDTWQEFVSWCNDEYDIDVFQVTDSAILANLAEAFYIGYMPKKHTFFTGAYMMTSMAKVYQQEQVQWMLNNTLAACSTKSLKAVTEAIAKTEYLGQFSAMQVAMDLAIPSVAINRGWADVDLDTWFAVGPGSKAGAACIRPDLQPLTLAKYLSQHQLEHLDVLTEHFGYPFAAPIHFAGIQYMRLIDFEHAFCEFSKYMRALKGGRMKALLTQKTSTSTWEPKLPVPFGWCAHVRTI